MSYEKRSEKAQKAIETFYKNGGSQTGELNFASIKKIGIEKIIEKNKKSHVTAKNRGTDKIRIKNSVNTKKEKNIYNLIGKKCSKTLKESGKLKGKNNPRAKIFKLISPNGEIIIAHGNLKEICLLYNINIRILKLYINKGKIIIKKITNKFSEKSINTIGWEILEERGI